LGKIAKIFVWRHLKGWRRKKEKGKAWLRTGEECGKGFLEPQSVAKVLLQTLRRLLPEAQIS
jgi:hypothetical protein